MFVNSEATQDFGTEHRAGRAKRSHGGMIQDTSLEAFYKIQSSLGRAQKEVLDALRTQPNATNAEIAWMLKWSINRVTPRVLELRSPDVGLIEEVGKRKCRVTGR